MKKALIAAIPVLTFAGVLFIAGCNTQREGKADRAILKAGQQVSADMVGWVAVPGGAPSVKEDKGAGVSYAVLARHNIVPTTMDGWMAVTPKFFAKLTGIKIEEPAQDNSEMWVLKPEGMSVPKDKNGWVAVPYSVPQIESSSHKKELEVADLFGNNVIPKEMNGWVAADKETMAKLFEKYMSTGKGSDVGKKKE